MAQPWFGALLGLGWQKSFDILTSQSYDIHGLLFSSPNAVLTRLAAQLYSSIFVHPLSVLIEPLYQPKVRDLARSGSKLGSVPFGIAACLKDRFMARARLDLARGSACSRPGSARGSAHCSSGLGSPRLDSAWLGSARLGWLLGVRLISVLGSDSIWGFGYNRLRNLFDARLGSARSLALAQLGSSRLGSP